jgi:NAD(P)-dependent dehydrogenase (short-subunit alcohol dehydrogenase family)
VLLSPSFLSTWLTAMQTMSKWSRLDILVLNSAVQHYAPSLEAITPSSLQESFAVNVFHAFYFAKHGVPHLPRGGAVVMSTSVTAYMGSAGLLDYSATKARYKLPFFSCHEIKLPAAVLVNDEMMQRMAFFFFLAAHLSRLRKQAIPLYVLQGAILAMVRSLAKQLAPKGIRVNGVAAGPVSKGRAFIKRVYPFYCLKNAKSLSSVLISIQSRAAVCFFSPL